MLGTGHFSRLFTTNMQEAMSCGLKSDLKSPPQVSVVPFNVHVPAAGQPDKSAQFCDASQLAALQERLAQHSKQDTTGSQQQQTQTQQQPHPQQQQHQQWHEQHSEQQQQQPMDEGEGEGEDWQAEDAVPMSTSPGTAPR
jgi:hypothetical protein